MSGKRKRQYLEDPAIERIPQRTRSCYLSQTLLQKESKTTQECPVQADAEAIFENQVAEEHKYGCHCHRALEAEPVCPNGCNGKIERFLMCNIEQQIENLLSVPITWQAIQSRFTHSTKDSTISDIYDGIAYTVHSQPGGFLSREYPANLSFTLSTDGVKVFKSSVSEVWPVWLVVNELPPYMRYSKKHVMLAGLWFSKDKPTMSTYLMPLMNKFNVLHETGILINTPAGAMISKSIILMCTADLPAKAKVANSVQYNGYYGCNTCTIPGVYIGHNMTWQFDPSAVIRCHDSILANAEDALQNNIPVLGMKGVPIFAVHEPFDLLRGMVIDVLHGVGGVIKLLLTSWFSKSKKREMYSIHDKLALCDAKLMAIKVPHIIKRPPKSLTIFNKWKAIEYFSLLLYYSVPLLHDVLSDECFNHYCLLVISLHILLSDKITEDMLFLAEESLHKFYVQYPNIYSAELTSMNVHLLSHLVLYTRAWGPVWTMSCFPFESMNFVLKKHFHGTREVAAQIAQNFSRLQLLPKLLVHIYNSDLSDDGRHMKTYVLGAEINLSEEELTDVQTFVLNSETDYGSITSCKGFARACIKGCIYHSTSYGRVTKQKSHTIIFQDDCRGCLSSGKVRYFVSYSSMNGTTKVVCAIEQFNEISTVTCPPTAMEIKRRQIFSPVMTNICTKKFIKAEQLVSLCIEIKKSDNESVIVKFPNRMDFIN